MAEGDRRDDEPRDRWRRRRGVESSAAAPAASEGPFMGSAMALRRSRKRFMLPYLLIGSWAMTAIPALCTPLKNLSLSVQSPCSLIKLTDRFSVLYEKLL